MCKVWTHHDRTWHTDRKGWMENNWIEFHVLAGFILCAVHLTGRDASICARNRCRRFACICFAHYVPFVSILGLNLLSSLKNARISICTSKWILMNLLLQNSYGRRWLLRYKPTFLFFCSFHCVAVKNELFKFGLTKTDSTFFYSSLKHSNL